jgi:chemotaxis protein CheD
LKINVVGISDMMVTNDIDKTLITYSLGSSLGVLIYDPVARVAGLLHSILPISKMDSQKAIRFPFVFVDTGVNLLFREAVKLGAEKKRLLVTAVGCSSLMDEKVFFQIGERNITVLRKFLWKNNILIDKHDIGGVSSKTVKISVTDGNITVKTRGLERVL